MASAGVATSDDCVKAFNELKLKHTNRYIIFKMTDDLSQIVIEKQGAPDATYDAFLKELPADDCRYAVFDFPFEVEGNPRSKIVFINWAPDTAKIRSKMVYASSKATIKSQLVGLAIEVQATDASEVDHSEVLAKCTAV